MEDWHNWRAQGIGASDAAVIMKKFPFRKTPLMLWEEKVSGNIQSSNRAMEHGNRNEPRAMAWAQSQLGVELIGQRRVEHPEMPWMRATLDGIDACNKVLVEIKCPFNLDNHAKVKDSGKVPDIYVPQVQHQMKVTELDRMFFVSYNHEDEDDSIIIEVQRDGEYLDTLVREEYTFLQYVVDRIPPPLTELDYKKRGDAWVKIASERMEIRDAMKELKKKDEELQKLLIEESEGISSSGAGFRFTKQVSKGSIDYSAALAHFIEELRASFPTMELPSSSDWEIFRRDPVTKWVLT